MKTTTPTEAKHSPTPFSFGRTGDDQKMILAADGSYVATIQIHQIPREAGKWMEPERLANAEFVLEACNAYESLLADKKELVGALGEVLDKHFRWDMMRETGGASERDLALQEMSDAELSARNLLARLDAKEGGGS